MPTAYEVPFEAQATSFVIDLAGATYRLTTQWCTAAACWLLNISTPDDVLIVGSIPIVPGVDLLKQYAYLGIAGQLFVQTAGDARAVPGYADLGVSGLVFFVVP